MKRNLLTLTFTLLVAALSAHAQAPIVVYNCQISDIGNTNIFANPAVVTWNPCRAQQADAISPGASAFFYAHEMCHATAHSGSEPAADICAAANVGPAVAQAAIRYFMIVAPTYPYLPQYGTAYDRVRRIAAAAGIPSPV
jgi:hypothetical protein